MFYIRCLLGRKTRMAHIKPSEILISKDKLSKVTEKILRHHSKYVLSGLFEITCNNEFAEKRPQVHWLVIGSAWNDTKTR